MTKALSEMLLLKDKFILIYFSKAFTSAPQRTALKLMISQSIDNKLFR